MLKALAAATIIAGSLVGLSSAKADIARLSPDVCMHQAPRDLCGHSLLVDLTGVTKFRFSLVGSAYTGLPGDVANKTVYLEYQDLNTETWHRCLGTLPCRGTTLLWAAPDQFGNTNKLWISPLVNLPTGQRKPTVVRLVMDRDDAVAPVIKEATIQFFP